jgi:hypothetical protein
MRFSLRSLRASATFAAKGSAVEALARDLVVASFAARWAIVKTILAKANVQLALAGAAVFLAEAFRFAHFALHTDVLFAGSGGAHNWTLSAEPSNAKMPEVMVSDRWKPEDRGARLSP